MSVVKVAKEQRELSRRQEDEYDRIYCVFDRDEHESFKDASKEARRRGFHLARSWPCFEYWLLLHFTDTRRPYGRSGRKSPADNCVSELKKHYPSYTKAAEGVFDDLRDRFDAAIGNAHKTLQDARATGEFNPSTEIHFLVDYLKSVVANHNEGP